MKGAYLDHASASPVRKEVLEAILPYFSEQFANPSNVYDLGSQIKQVVEEARANVARLIGATSEEMILLISSLSTILLTVSLVMP